jgi:hypothetical protein
MRMPASFSLAAENVRCSSEFLLTEKQFKEMKFDLPGHYTNKSGFFPEFMGRMIDLPLLPASRCGADFGYTSRLGSTL